MGEFLQTRPYGGTGQPGRLGHLADASSSDGTGFHRSPEAACAFIQERAQDGKLRCDSLYNGILHRAKHTTLIGEMVKLFWRASLEVSQHHDPGAYNEAGEEGPNGAQLSHDAHR